MSAPEPSAPRPRRRLAPRTPIGWGVAAIVAMVLIVALALLGVRYAVLTPQARLLIEARASGLKLGQLGTL